MSATREAVWEALEGVYDPELGLSLPALGLVYGIEVRAGEVRVIMTLTTPGCPLHDTMSQWVRHAVMAIPGVERVEVVVTFEPPWTPDRIRHAAPPAPARDLLIGERSPSCSSEIS